MASDLMVVRAGREGPRLILVEPYYTTSHAAFCQGLMKYVSARWTLLALPGRHWRWRMRGGASFLAQEAADILAQPYDGLVCSSMLGLAELKGLAPPLAKLPSLVVFHENQLAYPAPGRADDKQQRRDLFLGFSNLASAQAAHGVVFNSAYHRQEFLDAAAQLMRRLPDMAPSGLVESITAKSACLPIPMDTGLAQGLQREPRSGPLRILWNHRWAQDKDPDAFFEALFALSEKGVRFRLAVLGPQPAAWPKVFDQARERLAGHLEHWGGADERREYWQWLFWADVAVSTARQEYFGLAVAEAVWAGCRPLVPDDLVYPEIYPPQYRFQRDELEEALHGLMADPLAARQHSCGRLVENFTWDLQARPWREQVEQIMSRRQDK